MMRSMTRMAVAGCMALAVLGAVAVLDVGSSTVEAAPTVSPFVGSWSGTWSIPATSSTGTFDWTISDAGRITGSLYNDNRGSGGTIVGHVSADGKLMFTGHVPDDDPATGFNGFHFQGTAVIDSDGNLVVSARHMANEGFVEHLLGALLESY